MDESTQTFLKCKDQYEATINEIDKHCLDTVNNFLAQPYTRDIIPSTRNLITAQTPVITSALTVISKQIDSQSATIIPMLKSISDKLDVQNNLLQAIVDQLKIK